MNCLRMKIFPVPSMLLKNKPDKNNLTRVLLCVSLHQKVAQVVTTYKTSYPQILGIYHNRKVNSFSASDIDICYIALHTFQVVNRQSRLWIHTITTVHLWITTRYSCWEVKAFPKPIQVHFQSIFSFLSEVMFILQLCLFRIKQNEQKRENSNEVLFLIETFFLMESVYSHEE